jgi:hypothetical protein
MLEEGRPPQYVASCDRCSRTREELEAPSFDAARTALAARGWMECARRGKGVRRWEWWCPACRPSPAGPVGGLTTGHLMGDPR